MAKQDEFVRITLRLPPLLHARLSEVAGAGSLNAEILSRLESSFQMADLLDERIKAAETRLSKTQTEMQIASASMVRYMDSLNGRREASDFSEWLKNGERHTADLTPSSKTE